MVVVVAEVAGGNVGAVICYFMGVFGSFLFGHCWA